MINVLLNSFVNFIRKVYKSLNIIFFLVNNIIEVSFLTNINCSLNCIYQKDGQCSYSKIEYSDTISNSECAYFISASNEDLKK